MKLLAALKALLAFEIIRIGFWMLPDDEPRKAELARLLADMCQSVADAIECKHGGVLK